MTLLDRFRTTPRDKHPDPAVRLAYVADLPLEDRAIIGAIARDDDDPRVRRAAVAKLMDPALLGRIGRDDADETVRTQAAAMLRDVALEVFEGIGETDAIDAVDALEDARTLAQIAKSAAREIVALRALSRIGKPRAWGSIARHAVTEATRRGALALLGGRGDQGEILSVAMNGEYKDSALAAVDLLSDLSQLEQIVTRAKNKMAARRARTILKEEDERTGRTGGMDRTDGEDHASLDTSADRRGHGEGDPSTPHPTGGVRLEPDQDPAAVEEAAHHEREFAAERARAEGAEREVRAAMAAQEAQEQLRETERRHLRLSELAEQAASAADAADLATARTNLGVVRREWIALAAGVGVEAGLASRFADAEAELASREAQAREADARGRREALSRLQHLLSRVESLAANADLSLKAADRVVRDVRMALADMPRLPTKQDAEDVTRRLKAAQAALTLKLQELRDADDWQRWANVGVQEQLCAKMEALQLVEDPEQVAHDVRELQEQWRKAADVPRAQADALWRRFRTAHDIVWPRCEAHFAAEATARAENLAKKTALCEKAEALADSTNWIQTVEAVKGLQAEWKTIGAVPRGRERAIWERFRTGCDRFFTRRHEDLAQRKTIWGENLARKVALCEQAEALVQSTDWEQTAGAIKRLQVEWKTIGPVKKTRSEAIWQRFRVACNRFFARYAQRHDLAREERVAAREAICAELAAFAQEPPERPEAPADLLMKVRTLRAQWQQEIAARGVDPERARVLEERFAAAYAGVQARWPLPFAGTDLDPEANRKRMESLVGRVEALAKSVAGPTADTADAALSPLSPGTRLASMLKEALASNTIGGKVADDSRWRAAEEEVRQAQANWSRIGPVADDVRGPLSDRFYRACRFILDGAGKAGEAARPDKAGRPGKAGR